jgi:hypothetical protein
MVEPEVKDDDVAGSLHLSLSMTILLRGWSVVTCCAAALSTFTWHAVFTT